jgi:hypothetical protein
LLLPNAPLPNWYWYGDVPPVAFIVTEPLLPPKHNTLVCDWIEAANGADGWVIVTFIVEVQLLASRTVKVYEPAAKPLKVAPDWNAPLPFWYWYGAVPPVWLSVTEPVLLPRHNTLV